MDSAYGPLNGIDDENRNAIGAEDCERQIRYLGNQRIPSRDGILVRLIPATGVIRSHQVDAVTVHLLSTDEASGVHVNDIGPPVAVTPDHEGIRSSDIADITKGREEIRA